MDTQTARKALGDSGLVGVAFVLVGSLVLARENRRLAAGTLAVFVGGALLVHGFVDSFLESMGMEFDDLY